EDTDLKRPVMVRGAAPGGDPKQPAPKDRPLVRTVILANPPEGETEALRLKDVTKRLQHLPDWSVEQIFLSDKETRVKDPKTGEDDPDRSFFFNVRTSEREPEIVQATLDRLLQVKDPDTGQWDELLKKVIMDYDKIPEGSRDTKLRFKEADTGKKYFASLSFVKTLLARELLRPEGYDKKHTLELPFQIDLVGEGEVKEGRYQVAKLTFVATGDRRLTKEDLDKINQALERTAQAFRDRPLPERLDVFDSQLAAETQRRAIYAILLSW